MTMNDDEASAITARDMMGLEKPSRRPMKSRSALRLSTCALPLNADGVS